jgi:hypothetical protein
MEGAIRQMKILSKNHYNELINLKKLNEAEQAELEKYEMLKRQTSMENGMIYGEGYIAFNTNFWTAYLKDLQNEKAILQNKLNELSAELEWYKQKYLEFKFQEMEVKNNGLE